MYSEKGCQAYWRLQTKMYHNRKTLLPFICVFFSFLVVFVYKTHKDVKDIPDSFQQILSASSKLQITDKHGNPLNVTYQNRWNVHDVIELHDIPQFLKTAFIFSEDKRFYEHGGVDWLSRTSTLYSNLKNLRAVRGASTITEQTVRMINTRPRTLWSRWIEGFEAAALERQFDKDEILEFYLNQVPYASNRRGIVQAARFYFDRDIDTLSNKEMLTLVVLVRAPTRMDLHNNPGDSVQLSISALSERLYKKGVLSEIQRSSLQEQKFEIQKPAMDVYAPHFVQYALGQEELSYNRYKRIVTTIDGSLQKKVQSLSDEHLVNLKAKNVHNSAVLVVNHLTGEVLSWVVGRSQNANTPGIFINAVTTPRQPGSALKPFLYALALEKGWSSATIIEDTPLSESVGHGLHSYNNYSRSFYGPVTLRQALANSLNIPALKTLRYVGAEQYLRVLADLGFSELADHSNYYGDGISLGNGEVSLFHLVQAYSALANKGILRPLRVFHNSPAAQNSTRVFSEQVSSIIGTILSDAEARALEFGQNSVLNFPVETAVKTGTSSDYRDAWAVGYNYKYTVGVWMGNLDQQPTEGLTGSTGPTLLLRTIFSELTRNQQTKPLYLSPKLKRIDFCTNDRRLDPEDKNCVSQTEWFVSRNTTQFVKKEEKKEKIRIQIPSNNLHIAYDPRIPEKSQLLEFSIRGVEDNDEVLWNINDEKITGIGSKHLWTVKRGDYRLSAQVLRQGKQVAKTKQISFLVK